MKRQPRGRCRRSPGQALVFFMMCLVILVFVVLWNFDLHKVLFVKSIAQNAGDAAALMAARWQGTTLNLMGDLNLAHAVALTQNDPRAIHAITNIQARLSFVGPMVAFLAAQQAAKQNQLYVNPVFTEFIREHAEEVRNDYTQRFGDGGDMLFPEPYEGAWNDYADMLEHIADEGIAAGPENLSLYTDVTGGHILLERGFYEAIAGETWCWFFHHAPTLLRDYQNFLPCWWPSLPPISRVQPINSEIFSLHLRRLHTSLAAVGDEAYFERLAIERGFAGSDLEDNMPIEAVWYAYDSSWGPWDAMRTDGAEPFPLTGPVRDHYDYAGADAAVRVETATTLTTPASGGGLREGGLTWTAAAKPLGYLEGPRLPTECEIVLPAFREVALIPVDAASGSSGGGFDLEWRRHIEEHLPLYMELGPLPNACWYCRQLVTWENPVFRENGAAWLDINSRRCIPTGGGGGARRGGGTRRGH